MRKRSIVSMGFSALSQRKMRTSLTTLGIVVGIMTIVAISSLSGGFQTQITSMLSSGFEADVITVSSGGFFGGGGITFQPQDVQNISKLNHVTVATFTDQKLVQMFNGGKSVNASLYGVNFTEFFEIYPDKLAFASGSLPVPVHNNTLILGYSDNPIATVGQNVTIQFLIASYIVRNFTFRVEGTLGKVGFAGTTIIDGGALIVLSTLHDLYVNNGGTEQPNTILVKVDNPNQAEQVGDQIRSYFHDQASVIVASSFIKSLESILNIVTVFLLGIGSIALLVAGISIMNITMVSVMERTREIGVLKALGARNRTVLAQFLTEAALIGLMGGIIGIPLGLGVAFLLGRVLPAMFSSGSFSGFGGGGGAQFGMGQNLVLNPVIDPVSIGEAVIFALVITVVFAIYPARKASKLDPVTALRYE